MSDLYCGAAWMGDQLGRITGEGMSYVQGKNTWEAVEISAAIS
jgi:hypothetical protein